MFNYIKNLMFILALVTPMVTVAEPLRAPSPVDPATPATQSNFKKFITCKEETLSLSNNLSAATEKSGTFEKTIDSVILKFDDCRKLGDVVKQEAAIVSGTKDVIEATDISQERMKIEQKILVQIRDNVRLDQKTKDSTATQADKDFQALQIANSYVRQAEDLAWTKLTIRHNDSKVDSITFYNFFSVIFIVYFVIFIFRRNIKKNKV